MCSTVTRSLQQLLAACIMHVLVLSCPSKDDSPSLKIFTKPDPVFQHYKGNLSVICNVRRSGNQGNPVSKVYLRVMKGSTNATTSYTVVRPTLAKPLNVSLVAVYNDFVNESSLFIECIAWMDTGSCTSRLKSVVFTTSRPSAGTNEAPRHTSKAVIVGLTVAAIAFLIGIMIICLLWWKRRENISKSQLSLDVITPDLEHLPFSIDVSSDEQYSTEKAKDVVGGTGSFGGNFGDEEVSMLCFNGKRVAHFKESSTGVAEDSNNSDHGNAVIDLGDDVLLTLSRGADVIGTGKFGMVILGNTSHKNSSESEQVAVKMLKDFENPKHRSDFEKEVQSLTGLRHPNIVTLLATYIDEENFYIVMEYLAKGSLLDVLHSSTKESLGMMQLIMFARDVACGMEYLARKMIVHRDLAARNILIADNNSAKISDFGLARNIEETGQYITKEGYVALKWVSIEALESRQFTVESDIWSYGIVLWEIFTYGQDPYKFMSSEDANIFDLRDFLKTGKRLEPPGDCPSGINHLMRMCWSPFPGNRPSFSELKDTTQNMLSTFKDEEQASKEKCES